MAGGGLGGGQVGRVAGWEGPIHHQDVESRPVGGDLAGHGLEVEVPVDGGHHQKGGLALGGDETHLPAAVDGDEGVLAGPQAGQGAHQHQRFVPGGELPAHTGLPSDTVVGVQPGRRHQAGVTVAGKGELVTGVLVGQHGVGGGLGPPIDEPPQGGLPHPAPGRRPLPQIVDEVGHGAGVDHSWSV